MGIVLKTTSYPGGTATTESAFLSYSLRHEFNAPATATMVLKDPTGSIARKYANPKMNGAVSRVLVVYTTETAAANNDTASDMHLLDDTTAHAGDAYFFGFNSPVGGIFINLSQAGAGAGAGWTITWKYSQGSSVYANLAGVTDNTTGFTAATGIKSVYWTVPADWATDTVNSIAGLYWVCAYVSVAADVDTQPLASQAWPAMYIGPGEVTIEEPATTTVFSGRLVNSKWDGKSKTILIAEDWLSQLSEKRIDYDMREDLDGAGLRESTVAADTSGTDYGSGGFQPVRTDGANYYLYDENMAWDADEWNGKYLMFPVKAFGNITAPIGPHNEIVSVVLSITDSPVNGEENVWNDDGTAYHEMEDDAAVSFTTQYYFYCYPRAGSLYAGNINGGRIKVTYSLDAPSVSSSDPENSIYIKDQSAGSHKLGALNSDNTIHSGTYEIPKQFLTDAFLFDTYVSDVWFWVDVDAPAASNLKIYYISLELDISLSGYSSAITINDTITNRLTLATDVQGLGIYQDCPYSICKPIYKHIDSGESGTLIGNGDTMKALTYGATIEHTTGISARHYTNKTRLEILKDLAELDRAVFWIGLGGTTVNWKKTFADGTTAMADSTVLSWSAIEYDYKPMANQCKAIGARIGNEQVEATSNDTTSTTLYNATRTEVVNDSGLLTDADATAIAASVVARKKDIKLNIEAELAGLNTTFALGTQVAITSTLLGLDGSGEEDYFVVTKWAYDSNTWRTSIELKPRGSVGFNERAIFGQNIKTGLEQTRETARDLVTQDLTTQSWPNP